MHFPSSWRPVMSGSNCKECRACDHAGGFDWKIRILNYLILSYHLSRVPLRLANVTLCVKKQLLNPTLSRISERLISLMNHLLGLPSIYQQNARGSTRQNKHHWHSWHKSDRMQKKRWDLDYHQSVVYTVRDRKRFTITLAATANTWLALLLPIP